VGPSECRGGYSTGRPMEVVVRLMNAAQERMLQDFSEHLIGARVARLWPDSAYVGSCGDIMSGKVQGYMRKWEAGAQV
jgi:REP element-mobilizing transposase RayT